MLASSFSSSPFLAQKESREMEEMGAEDEGGEKKKFSGLPSCEKVFSKISSNIREICAEVEKLRMMALSVTPVRDVGHKRKQQDSLSLKIASKISETLDMIKYTKNYEYTNKNEKITNITRANSLEDECLKYKQSFEEILRETKVREKKRIAERSNLSGFSLNCEENNGRSSRNSFFEDDNGNLNPVPTPLGPRQSLLTLLDTKNTLERGIEATLTLGEPRESCLARHWRMLVVVGALGALVAVYMWRK